jgi:hypothetical protein
VQYAFAVDALIFQHQLNIRLEMQCPPRKQLGRPGMQPLRIANDDGTCNWGTTHNHRGFNDE